MYEIKNKKGEVIASYDNIRDARKAIRGTSNYVHYSSKKKESIVGKLSDIKRTTILRNARRSQNWLKNKINKGDFDKKMLRTKPLIGRMYMYVYSPKYKATLPYWDRNPLVIVINKYPGGYLGLNLHYLAPKTRLILLNKLMSFATSKKLTDKTRFRMTYDMLNGVSRYKEFKPTIHRYLYSHLKTKLALIPASEWKIVIFLPTARFVGSSNTAVYKDSRSAF